MELYQFLHFQTVAKYENFSRAAEVLHISQPALSMSIKKLELELGVQLFDRKKNKIHLNTNGKLALFHVEKISHQ